MLGQNYYLLTALPGLGELGSDPPLSPQAMLEMLAPDAGPCELASVIFLSDDLQLRQAVQAGEVSPQEAEPIVLSAEQVRDEAPLPPSLIGEDSESAPADQAQLGVDRVWAMYFAHGARLATASNMLAEWVRYEVGLRNALASARAKALGLDAERYLVTPELGCEDNQYTNVLGEWSAAPNPLAGLQVLDSARWAWIGEHDGWFTFKNDELVAYAARLVILHRWKRIAAAQHQQDSKPAQS